MRNVTPASNWPIKSRVILLDAWMRNPVRVKITRHPNVDHIVAEDLTGIVYYARTDRIEGKDPDSMEVVDLFPEFSDILG